MQTETSEKPGQSGAVVSTVCGVVFLLLLGPLVIVVVEMICFGTFHFETALKAVGVHDFYAWFSSVTGITDFVIYLLGAFNLSP